MTQHKGNDVIADENGSFADLIIESVESGINGDGKVLSLYSDLDDLLNTGIEDLSAAHFISFIWSILVNISFEDMVMSADEAAEILKKDLLEALRSSLIKIYKQDIEMGCVTYSSEDEEQLNTIRQILGSCGNCRTRSCHDEHDITDRELDPDFDDMEGK